MVQIKSNRLTKLLTAILGMFLFSLGLNLIIAPVRLYNGGVVGISQIINTMLSSYLQLNLDLSGFITYIINIPLLFLAYRELGKIFFFNTIVCVTFQSLFMTIIPIPAKPMIPDPLTACLIGGLLTGYGVGLALRCGGSGGGLEILGIYLAKRYKDFSVGRLALWVNLVIYLVCALLFNITTVIYSVIYSSIQAMRLDKIHEQNINMEVLIFSKNQTGTIKEALTNKLERGGTYWSGQGAYTGTETSILYTIISKYEINQLRELIHSIDPEAFITYKEGVAVSGNFIKRL